MQVIKLPFANKFFVLSIFEWLRKTGYTVYHSNIQKFHFIGVREVTLDW